jgi:hypothetical protein
MRQHLALCGLVAVLLAPLPLGAQVTAPAAGVKPEVAPTGETVAVPTAPPASSVEAEVEAEVQQEVKEAEEAVGAASSDIAGEDSTIPSQSLEPDQIVPQTGG